MAVVGSGVTQGAGSVIGPPSAQYYADDTVSGWTGYIGFAAMMLILIGCFHAVAGFVGIFKDGYFAAPKRQLLITVDYTAWGWIHLAFGIVAILVAVGMLAGQFWARIVAVAFAIVSALANLAFLQAQPVWSTLIIAFDVLLIYALTVHGAEMKRT